MKKIKRFKVFLTLSLLLMTFIANAQVTIFRTFEDFKNQEGEQLDSYSYTMNSIGTIKLVFMKDGEKVKFKTREIWGFFYKNAFFRIDEITQLSLRVMSAGKVIYYENGAAHLTMLRDDKNSGSFSDGNFSYISQNINSEIIPINWRINKKRKNPYLKLKEENPESKELFDCIEKDIDYKNIRECFEKYQGQDDEDEE